MGAPNKIFLGIGPISCREPEKKYLYAEWYETPHKPPVKNINYIREDAIIDMLEDAIKNLSDGSLAGYYESMACQDIIEKIKEL